MYRRGLYEIVFGFFLVVVLVFGLIFMLSAATGSNELFAGVKRSIDAPREASAAKDVLLACHRVTHLDADLFGNPCRAKEMERGFAVRQIPLNGCNATVWEFIRGEPDQITPFVVAVEQPNMTRKCLAVLEVAR